MKVAINIENFSRSKGGGEGYASGLAHQLVRDGEEVHIFANSFEEKEGLIFHKVPVIKFPLSLKVLSFAINSARLLAKHDFDIIQGFGGCWCVDVYRPGGGTEKGWFWQDLKAIDNPFRKTATFMLRLISLRELCHLYVERKIYKKRGVRIIANSRMVKADIMKYYRLEGSRIEVIYNGVDLNRFSPVNREIFRKEIRNRYNIGDEFLILFVSNNYRLKGLQYLIRALGELKKRADVHIKLLIAGKGRESPYKTLAKRLSCNNMLIFAGPTEEVEKFYGAADLLVHPSFYDPFANVCLEALASGIPVITTKHNGSGEIITDGREGFVIGDPGKVAELAEKISYFFDGKARKEASVNARRRAEKHSVERNYAEILKIYKEKEIGRYRRRK
jgi:UDP-glucose:(heptosyl)LPS alpha-1,3-glucosyltransferase